MTKKISLVASSLLLTSTMAFAESASIKDAFKNGTTSGDITVHTTSEDNDGTDEGFTAGTVGVNYETDTFKGFKVSLGFRAAHEFSEEEENDYDNEFAEDSVLHTAAISYANDDFFVSIGRQEIDLEWADDFHESVVTGLTAIPDTTVVAAFANREALAAEDELTDFEEYATKEGAYIFDIKNTSISGLEINPYFYSADKLADWYGLKLSYANDLFGLIGHYAASSEDNGTGDSGKADDGSILHLEASTELAGVSIAAGYITTDEDGGVGSMSYLGDNIDPTDSLAADDGAVYGPDADTYYVSLGYSIAGLDLSAQYSDSEYGSTDKEADEIYLTAGYAFTDELSILVEYTDYEIDNADTDEISATLTYSF